MNGVPHGGLRIEGTIAGIGASEAATINTEWNSYTDAIRYLEDQLGMAPLKEPEFPYPSLRVEDLTTTDNKAYTEAYMHRVAWFGFLSEQKAKHDAVRLELEAKMSMIETRIRQEMRKHSRKVTRAGETKAPPAQEMEDAINSDHHYIELKKKLVLHEQVLKLLNSRVETADREIRLTSRQVEIRRQDFDNASRGNASIRQPGMRQPGSYGRG